MKTTVNLSMKGTKGFHPIPIKTAKTWLFFYHINRTEKQFAYAWVVCKQPQRTKQYKLLKEFWSTCEKSITSIGYTNDLNSIWIHWPQSSLETFEEKQDRINKQIELDECDDMEKY